MRNSLGNINKYDIYYLAYNYSEMEMIQGNRNLSLCK